MIHKITRTAAIFIVMALLLPTLAACGTGSLAGATPTPIAAATPCTTDVTVGAVIVSTPEGTMTQATTPTPGTPADAPAYAEINTKLQALRDLLAGISTNDQYTEKEAEIEQLMKELNDAWTAIGGKTIKGWEGWVIATGANAAAMGQHMGLEMPENMLDNDQIVLISLFDPYAATQTTAQKAKARGSMMQPFSAPEPFVLINKPATTDNKSLCLGQKVTFTGVPDKAFYMGDNLGAFLSQATVTITEDKLGDLKAFAGMEGTAIHFERTMCFGFCPDYEVTVFGNGVVLFHGRNHTKVQGYRIATVDQATVQKLLDAFDATKFSTMPSYTKYEVTDMASAAITMVKGSETHTVDHYQGDHSAPEALTNLENSIDDILNTAQWIN